MRKMGEEEKEFCGLGEEGSSSEIIITMIIASGIVKNLGVGLKVPTVHYRLSSVGREKSGENFCTMWKQNSTKPPSSTHPSNFSMRYSNYTTS